ncbi:MAG: tandem-95 repeat protein, partial [Pseudomonadota bacterium]
MEQELNLIEGTARADFLIGSWKDDLILSGAGNDVVFARSGNDIVDAGDGNDAVFAGDGDDLVMTGLGRDYADGGRGIDTAKFDGDRSDYRVVSFFGIVFVTDLRNGETDTLRNFEFLEFDDGRYFPDGSPVQRPPEAVDDEAETSEDAPVSIDVLANDSDPNDDSLTVIEATADNGEVIIEADGTLTYTPDENFSGKDKISYTISDGNGGTSSATVAVQVGGVADEPTLAAQTSYETLDLAEIPLSDLVAKLVDQDGSERLTVKFNKLPEGAMISIPAAIAEKDLGIEELTARRSRLLEEVEERESEIAALNRQIDLLERDDPSSPDLPGLREQRDETIRQLTAKQDEKNEVEAELELATKERAELSKTAGPDGMIEFDDISSGFVLKLPPGTTEDFVLEVHAIATESDPVASEDVRTAVSKLEIEINVKESPSLKDDEAATREDTPVIIKVLENDSDSDGDDLSVVEFTDGANGRTFLNPDGTITYRPDPNTSGEDQFTYTVEDGNGGRSTATVKLLVGGVADRPLFEKYDTFVVRDLAEVPLDGFAARLQDRDGSEKLTLKFFGLPAGSVILNAPAIAEKEAAISELESRLILLRNEIDVLEQDLREVSARIEDLQQTNPDSEELPGLLEQKASLESQVQDKA